MGDSRPAPPGTISVEQRRRVLLDHPSEEQAMTQALRPAEDEQAASAKASRRRTQGRQGHPGPPAPVPNDRSERRLEHAAPARGGVGAIPHHTNGFAVLVRIVQTTPSAGTSTALLGLYRPTAVPLRSSATVLRARQNT
jgi:hypothetical protein